MKTRPDPTGLVAGVSITLLGGLLMLDQAGALDLEPGWAAVALTAVAGLILLVSGIVDGDRR